MGNQVYSLEDVRRGKCPLYPQHLEHLKAELNRYVRADWKKQRIANLTYERIMALPPHWCFARIQYLVDGTTRNGCGYVTGQDTSSEMKAVVTAFTGKK